MKKLFIFSLCLPLLLACGNSDDKAAKTTALQDLRHAFSTTKIGAPVLKTTLDESLSLMDSEGRFTDTRAGEDEIEQGAYALGTDMQQCIFINNVARDCFERIWTIAETYRGQSALNPDDAHLRRLLQSIVYYGKLENERNDEAPGRWHASCFATPRAAVNVYFCLFDLMERIEAGELTDSLAQTAHRKLMDVAFQSWRQPLRHDETDHHIVSVERFRKHVWWVGGNALDYRPVFETAVMMSSLPMIDVMAEVAKKSISCVSQTTLDEAFWTEGITADGAGWGHGKQCLVWGYPIDGLKGTFRILAYLKGTPWSQNLSRENVDLLLNYIRSSAFYHYKGVVPPLVDRNNMTKRNDRKGGIASQRIAHTLLTDWKSSLTPEEAKELEDFIRESSQQDINMSTYPAGHYHGVKYFYNNDDIIKKTPSYYLFVNMASNRVDGLESAWPLAAGYNFYSADGVTLFQRNGSDYRSIIGAMNLTAWPGVTTRQTPVPLQPIENWRGFTSKHNFAAGAGNNADSFAAGFIYEKMNGSMRDNADFAVRNDKNKEIYGVRAYKSYFMFNDVFLALGSGITNLQPELEGDVTTTIEQSISPAKLIETSTQGTNPIRWIENNGFAYAVLPAYTTGTVHATRETRKTNWQRLTEANKNEENTEVSVFQMEINHGRYAKDATYAYMVNCGTGIPTAIPTILSNTTALQAAESAAGKQLGAVFFDCNALLEASMGTFSVSHPVVMFAEQVGNELRITVTDARMDTNLNELTLATSLPIEGTGVVKTGEKMFQVTISLPQEPDRGAPVTTVFSISR